MVDGKRDYIYPFRNFTLKSGKAVKVLFDFCLLISANAWQCPIDYCLAHDISIQLQLLYINDKTNARHKQILILMSYIWFE